MPLPCSNYRTEFESFAFQFNFTTDSLNFMRIPLATFAVLGSSGTCNILITDLDYLNS